MKSAMNALPVLLLAGGLCAANSHAGTVTLTTDDVTDAADIEAAINTATNHGTEPGKVILDGSEGRFSFPELSDQDIGITVSNLTLAGINDAAIDAVLTFGSVEVKDILIENIELRSPFEDGVAIVSTGPNSTTNVTIRKNAISSQLSAIFVANAIGWKIHRNRISSGADEGAGSITLLGANDSEVIGNTVNSNAWGILLTSSSPHESTGNKVIANRVAASGRGIALNGVATQNTVLLNRINLISSVGTGIFLDTGTSKNRVQLNKASIAEGGSLTAVEDLGTNNKVSSNSP